MICLFGVIPSVLLPLYAYSVDKTHASFLGTDIPLYLSLTGSLNAFQNDPSLSLYQSFIVLAGGSRPFSILALHFLPILLNQTEEIVLKYLPALLGPLLVLSVYYLTRTSYPKKSTFSSNCSNTDCCFSPDNHWLLRSILCKLVGINYNVHFNNIFAQEFTIPNRKNLTLFATFTILTLFFHSFVWSYYIAVVVLFLDWSAV